MFEDKIRPAAADAASATALLDQAINETYGKDRRPVAKRVSSNDASFTPQELANIIDVDQILRLNHTSGRGGHAFSADYKATKDDLSGALASGRLGERQANAVSFMLRHYNQIRHVHPDADDWIMEGGIEQADMDMLPRVLSTDGEAARLQAKELYVQRSAARFDVVLGLAGAAVATAFLIGRFPMASAVIAATGGQAALLTPVLGAAGIALGLHFTGADRMFGNMSYYTLQKARMGMLSHAFKH